jgi:hypothetical protein
VPVVSYSPKPGTLSYPLCEAIWAPTASSWGSSSGKRCATVPGGRRMRLPKVWLVTSIVTWRDATSSRMFWVSGSEKGAGPR